MAGDLAISDVARVFGLRTSAIRYYEQIGILPPAMREPDDLEAYFYGWSIFDCLPTGMYEQPSAGTGTVMRPSVLQGYAREAGFTLEEIRELFFGFPAGTPPPKRWHQLSQRKIAELRERMKRLQLMEALLKRVEDCRCHALEDCREKILRQRSR